MAYIITGILVMLLGLAGVLLPFLPGVPLAWVGMFIYAYGTDFAVISGKAVLVFLILTIASVILEFVLPLLGAKKYRASKQGLIGAAIGLLVGPLVLNAPGIIVGPFAGAVIGEYIAGKEKQAWVSGFGTFLGFMVSMVSRFILVLVMIGYVVTKMLWNA